MESKKMLGCFSYPGIVLLSIIGSGVIGAFTSISVFYGFVMLLLLFSWLFGKAEKKKAKKAIHRFQTYSMILIVLIICFRYIALQNLNTPNNKNDISESLHKEKTIENGDSITLLTQKRNWKDNYGNDYKAQFSVREDDYTDSRRDYFKYAQNQNRFTWGSLYQHLADSDVPRLDLIIAKLSEIKVNNTLNQIEFAEMVVTFIQDIPYSLVFSDQCFPAENYEKSIRQVLENCPDCCIGNIPYGIQNPVAFMGNLKGDCDTRTVIIYTILDHFGYDVAILNSEYYRHSILGLNLPYTGRYKTYQGKRYYTWETTNKYYTLGTIPETMDNLTYWEVVLTNT